MNRWHLRMKTCTHCLEMGGKAETSTLAISVLTGHPWPRMHNLVCWSWGQVGCSSSIFSSHSIFSSILGEFVYTADPSASALVYRFFGCSSSCITTGCRIALLQIQALLKLSFWAAVCCIFQAKLRLSREKHDMSKMWRTETLFSGPVFENMLLPCHSPKLTLKFILEAKT